MVKWIFAFFTLVSSAWASELPPQSWVFYQPQQQDKQITAEQWQGLMLTLKQAGAKGLVLQWSAYGNNQFYRPYELPLTQRAQLASQAGLQVMVGLYLDDDYFERIKQSAASLPFYLNKQRALSLQQAQRWHEFSQQDGFAGWYIPEEIDDYHWQDATKKQLLMQHLSATHQALIELTPDAPIYISAYIGGHLPAVKAQTLLQDISLQGKLNVWLQDGIGTGALNAAQREMYFSGIFSCQGKETAPEGVVLERFRQDKQAQSFFATGASQSEWQQQLQLAKAWCPRQTAIFSLRYLALAQTTFAG